MVCFEDIYCINRQKNKMAKYFLLFIGFIVISCNTATNEKNTDTVAMGEISISADESLMPVVSALEGTFEGINRAAKINVIYKPEQEAINQLLLDSARVTIITRELTEKEQTSFKEQKLKYRSLKVGIDAVALIGNKSNYDTLITLAKLKNLILGIDKSRELVVDNVNSSNLNTVLNKLKITDYSKLKLRLANSNKGVIEYVKANPKSIGLIGVNWISDGDDPASMGFLKTINVISVAENNDSKPNEFYLPFEYNLYLKNYPIMRNIYMITKEARQGLGTGFINFAAKEKGQLIIQKTGILPATQPLRLYKVQN
jgi:phosphate transport system substrate-binding protein